MNSDDRARALARLRNQAWWCDDDRDDVAWDGDEDDLDPVPPLNLGGIQQTELAAAIADALQQRGCDNTLRRAELDRRLGAAPVGGKRCGAGPVGGVMATSHELERLCRRVRA